MYAEERQDRGVALLERTGRVAASAWPAIST